VLWRRSAQREGALLGISDALIYFWSSCNSLLSVFSLYHSQLVLFPICREIIMLLCYVVWEGSHVVVLFTLQFFLNFFSSAVWTQLQREQQHNNIAHITGLTYTVWILRYWFVACKFLYIRDRLIFKFISNGQVWSSSSEIWEWCWPIRINSSSAIPKIPWRDFTSS
jgi:hypothetical protein